MTPRFIVLHSGGTARMSGLQHPNAKVLARTKDTVAIKVPSHTYANGVRGISRGYEPAETIVFRLLKAHGVAGYGMCGYGEGFDVEVLLRWTHERADKANKD